jgi:hypothetical protein
MAAYVAGDVTVTVTSLERIGPKKKLSIGTMAVAGAGPTYPTAGIPLPAISAFGFLQQMDSLKVFGNNARTVSYLFQYNKSAHKLLVYEEEGTAAGGPLLEADTSEAPAAVTLDYEAVGF